MAAFGLVPSVEFSYIYASSRRNFPSQLESRMVDLKGKSPRKVSDSAFFASTVDII